MPTARYGPAVGVINGKLYVAGGCCSQFVPPFDRFPNLEVYDPANNTWANGSPIPMPIYAAVSGVLNGRLYVAGGQASQTNGTNRADLQVYDPLTDSWSFKAPMPSPSSAMAGGFIGGKFYVAGGMNPANTLSTSTLRVYDPVTDQWTTKAPMSVVRAAAGGGVVNGILYVAGGLDSAGIPLNSVEAYDPVTDTWTTKAAMPTTRYFVGAEVAGGLLYIIGGSDTVNTLATVEVYNPITNSWTTDASMSTGRVAPGAGILNGTLYAVGGLSNPSALLASVEAFTAAPVSAPTPTWNQLTPTGGAPADRAYQSAVYDTANNRMTVFAGGTGQFCSGAPPLRNDVWVLANADGSGGAPNWSQLFPTGSAPAPRGGQASVYDAVTNRMIVYGGDLSIGNCNSAVNDVWVLTNANGLGGTPAWTQLSPSGGPPQLRQHPKAVYNSDTNRLIVYSGNNNGCQPFNAGEVWVLSNANGTGGTPVWTQLIPTGGPPAPRDSTALQYDAANNRMIVFGGYTAAGFTNDLWVLSNADGLGGTPNWTQLLPAGSVPGVRADHTAVYNAAVNQMVVFGGQDPVGNRFNDVWVLANANGLGGAPAWNQITTTGGPPTARSVHTAVYNPTSNRMTVYAGWDSSCFARGDLWTLADAASGAPTPSPSPSPSPTPTPTATPVPTPTPTPFPITAKGNGKLAFTADPGNGTRQIFVSDADGANPAQLTNLGGDFTPAFSPDGTKIAFVSKRDGNGEIYVMNADGSNQVRLTNVPQADGGPTWSPDGARIAFLSGRNPTGNSQIYVMNADGTNQTRLTNNSASYSHPAWSPDGTRIAADSNRVGRAHLYVMNSDGSNEMQLLPSPETTLEEAQPAWSPDGTRLLFAGGDFAGGLSDIVSSKLYSMRVDGSDPVQLTMSPAAALDISPTYSPNGLRIAFVRYSDAAASVGAVVTADSGGCSVSPPIHDSIEGHAVSWQPVNDTTAPTTNADLNGTVGSNGWYTSNVSVTLNAADNSGGTGVKRISYSASGAQAIAPTTAGGASINFTINAEGETTLTYFATDNADNVEAAQTVTVKIDKTMPAIDCASPDGSWHAVDVRLACSSNDGQSGLSNAADANFTLSTSVAAGTENANAPTGSRTVCDRAGNCAAVGPVGGNKVDKKAPDITITVPASGVTFALGQVVAAAYNCNDGTGAGIATCAGPVANGANLDTSAGSHVFTVTSTDNVGNANSTSVTYSAKGAAEQVADLMALIDSFNLKKKVDKKFDHKLNEVLKALNKNKTDEACKKLADLIKDAQHQSGKKLTAAEANQIIDAAHQIRAVLGCVR